MNQDKKAKPKQDRKPYATPQLVEYGSITKLTQGNQTNSGDSGGSGRREPANPCL